MLSFIFFALMAIVFGRLAFLSVKLTWNFTKVFVTLVFAPLILVIALFMGFVQLALPLLIIVGIISIFVK